jgi:hypothetical protein
MLRLTKLLLTSKFRLQRQLATRVLQEFNSKLEFSLESGVFLKCNHSHLDSLVCHPGRLLQTWFQDQELRLLLYTESGCWGKTRILYWNLSKINLLIFPRSLSKISPLIRVCEAERNQVGVLGCEQRQEFYLQVTAEPKIKKPLRSQSVHHEPRLHAKAPTKPVPSLAASSFSHQAHPMHGWQDRLAAASFEL